MPYIIHRINKLHTVNAHRRHNARGNALHLEGTMMTDSEIKRAYNARKNSVLAVEAIYTATPEVIKGWTDEKQHAFYMDCLEWHKKTYGAVIISADIHEDESTPHIHIISIPLDERGRLNAKKIIGDKVKMTQRQSDIAAEVGARYGLTRGREDTKRKHIPLYTRKQATEALEEARKELQAITQAYEALKSLYEPYAREDKNPTYNDLYI